MANVNAQPAERAHARYFARLEIDAQDSQLLRVLAQGHGQDCADKFRDKRKFLFGAFVQKP